MNKTVLLIIVAMIMSACGTTLQATPTALPPTASFTPSPTNTPQPTVTLSPTPAPRIGTVYLDPEYDLDDRVKIIEANQEALWKYTTESFMMLNSYTQGGNRSGSYMQKLAESIGIDFNDKDALREYLKNNEIPIEINGANLMYTGSSLTAGSSVIGVRPLEISGQKVNLFRFPVQIVSLEDYSEWAKKNEDVLGKLVLIAADKNTNTYEIFGGLIPVDKGDYIEFEYVIINVVRDNTTSFKEFPEPNESISISQSNKLNTYLDALVYSMRIFSDVFTPSLNELQKNAMWGLGTFEFTRTYKAPPRIGGTVYYFPWIYQYMDQLPDFPPGFIEPR